VSASAGEKIETGLPAPLVYLRDVDPSILQDMRYATANNFTGRAVPGYEAAECILVRPAAEALAKVQSDLRGAKLSLKVYDCLRPQRAVRAFVAWSEIPGGDLVETDSFHPRIKRNQLLSLGYIARASSHSRGVAVDLTLVPIPEPQVPAFDPNAAHAPCNNPSNSRTPDSSVDMGTGFDCFDPMSHTRSAEISPPQRQWRRVLTEVMQKRGFRNYQNEWWHFTFETTGASRVFDFPITAPRSGREPPETPVK
jgi:D-alanyl-D-alanine dipeptidase